MELSHLLCGVRRSRAVCDALKPARHEPAPLFRRAGGGTRPDGIYEWYTTADTPLDVAALAAP